MKRPLRFLLATTIVAAIDTHFAAAAADSDDVPVPGGRAAIADALNLQTVPDRARFVSEMARIIYASSDRKLIVPELVGARLRAAAAASSAPLELIPVPLTADVWSKAVFMRPVGAGDLVLSILEDRQAALLAYGLAALDDETLQFFADRPVVLRQIYTFGAEPFAVFSSNLHIRGGRVLPPGSDEAIALWESIVREPVAQPDRFVPALFTAGEGRVAYLYDTIGTLDAPRQRFALGLWMPERAARLEHMQALAGAVLALDWRSMKVQPFVRQAYDLSAALDRVSVDVSGRPAPPASRLFWTRALEGADLPDDPARLLQAASDDRPVDAAWLAGLVASTDIRLRADRLDQFAFGQRVFATASAAQMPDVLVATRAFRRYRTLMFALERMGIRNPALYTRAAHAAARLPSAEPARAFAAIAQFQGALALLWRMRLVGTLDTARTEALVSTLLAVPLNPASQYAGGVLRWLSHDVRPALPPGNSLEGAVHAAIAGLPAAAAPRIQWEGRMYRVDVGAAERRRIERIRDRQRSATLDLALDLAAAADRLASGPPTPATVDDVRSRATAVASELSALSRNRPDPGAESFPPGVVPPPDPRDALASALADLAPGSGSTLQVRLVRAAGALLDAADLAAAQALVSLVYAINLGDPDGAALLPGDVSYRHDFGFGQRDTEQRLRAAWMVPRQDVSPGIPWHIDGSLLGLDVAMATSALRRLSSDRALAAPTLSSNERETFAVGFGLMNPFELTDAARDAIAAAIDRGRQRVADLDGPAEVDAVADELHMEGWRHRAARWTVVNEPDRLESFFSLREMLALGRPDPGLDLDPWGTSAMVSTGCFCTRMAPPGRLPLVIGRRQIGLLATALPDLNLHVARTLSRLRLPAPLAKYVLSAAVLDYVDEVRAADSDDWLSLARGAVEVPQERIEDYVAAAAADGPLLPDATR